MDSILQDVRYAFRTLRRQPGLTAAIVLGLALGIGANVAVFSVVNAVLYRPLPFAEPDRLVRVYLTRDGGPPFISLRPRTYLEIRDAGKFFEEIAAQRYTTLTLESSDGPQRVVGLGVTDGWSETLGVEPVLGRTFSEEELEGGAGSGVAIVGHGFWEGRLGSDPDVLGRRLVLDDRPVTVIGVMPPGFVYPYSTEIWLPMNLRLAPDARWGLNVQARMAPGVDLSEARSDLGRLGALLADSYPEVHRDMRLVPIPTRQVLIGERGQLATALLVCVGFVLMIACANVGSVLLARSAVRAREIALRAALGASRGRQLRQLLTESLVLAGLGGAGGLALAALSVDSLEVLLPGRLSYVMEGIPLDGAVVGFALAASLLTGVLFGLPMAVRASRRDPAGTLQRGGRGSAGAPRILDAFVVLETAAALALLVGAVMMVQNFRGLARLDLGYPDEGLTTLAVSLSGDAYSSPEARRRFVASAVEALEARPEVDSAGATTMYPSPEGNSLARVEFEGRPAGEGEAPIVNHRMVTPGFLETLGVPLVRGRSISRADRPDAAPVVVVSRGMAERYWPGEDPVGRRVRNASQGPDAPWMTVVGVVGDVREFWNVEETWYVPLVQHADSAQTAGPTFVARLPSGWAGESLAAALRAAVWEVDPGLPVFDVADVRQRYRESLGPQRLGSALVGGFAGFGLFLAALGVYGLAFYAVGRSRTEIAVRMALGATPSDIRRWVLGRGLRQALVAVPLGIVASLALARYLRRLLPEVERLDPVLLAILAAVLVASALLASYLPARRAMRLAPGEVLGKD